MKIAKRIWNIITTLLVILLFLLAVALFGVRLLGFDVYTVLSGSMEPTYHTGSLLYVDEVDYKQLKENDIITFMLNENTVATHRIIEVVPDESDPEVIRFRTQGDANDAEDGGMVHYKNIIGSPKFDVPYLGYVADFIKNPPGSYIAISMAAILLILLFLPDLIFSDDENEKKKSAKKDNDSKEESDPVLSDDSAVEAEDKSNN